jgi:hypothetical protein
VNKKEDIVNKLKKHIYSYFAIQRMQNINKEVIYGLQLANVERGRVLE